MNNKPLIVLCALLVVAEGAIGFHFDFQVYWEAARRLFEGGWGAVYDPKALTPFKYHPFTVLLFAPLAALPWWLAGAIWSILNGFFTWDACRRFQQQFQTPNWVPVVALFLVFHAWSWQLKFGNVTCLMLWLFSLQATVSRPLVRSAAIALLLLIKPFWLALLPVLVLEKNWRVLGQSLLFASLGSAVVFLFGISEGLQAYELWQATLADPTNAHNYPKNDNQCLYAMLYRGAWDWSRPEFLVWAAFSGGYLALALLQAKATHFARSLALLSPMLFAGPLSWIHHQILVAPVLMYLLQRRQWAWAAAATLFFSGTGELFVGREWFVALYQFGVPVWGYLVLSVAIFRLSEKEAQQDAA